MTPIDKLDAVLVYLANTNPPYKTLGDEVIFSDLIHNNPQLKDQNYFRNELKSILQKLNRDGYVDIDSVNVGRQGMLGQPGYAYFYSITFDGLYFITGMDGYLGQHRRMIAESTREEKLETFHKKQAVFLSRGTWGIAIGALTLVLWDILKTFWIEPCQ